MTTAPGSLESLRSRNRLRVLETVQQRGAVSRVDIIRTTGLSRTTVSSLVAELLAEGVLSEPAGRHAPARGGGRPATLVALNPDGGGVLGVHLGHDGVRVVLADLSGGVLGERQQEIDVDHLPADSRGGGAGAARGRGAGAGRPGGRGGGGGGAGAAPGQL